MDCGNAEIAEDGFRGLEDGSMYKKIISSEISKKYFELNGD